jgi:hypothetical protein
MIPISTAELELQSNTQLQHRLDALKDVRSTMVEEELPIDARRPVDDQIQTIEEILEERGAHDTVDEWRAEALGFTDEDPPEGADRSELETEGDDEEES